MNEHLKKYIHKESWLRRHKNFSVEVTVWKSGNEFIWNIYCYIYKNHKLFNELTDESLFGGSILNFSGGCTFGQWFRNNTGEIITKKYGNDYNHIWNLPELLLTKNPEDAIEVFNDAEDLYNFLEGVNS